MTGGPAFRCVASLTLVLVIALAPASPRAQGRCIRAFGTPACNTGPVPAPVAPTGWRTVALEQITFRVADPEAEAGFYAALLGWTVRSADAGRIVMDVGDWGTVIFKAAPRASFTGPVRATVEGFGFAIAPWDRGAVESALRSRGLSPTRDLGTGTTGNGEPGLESVHVKDVDGFDLQLTNGRGDGRRRAAASRKPSVKMPFAATGWTTVWLDHFSFNATDYKKSAAFYAALLGWQPTYDEGSQNELMIADVGDIIIRGGNPLAPGFTGTPPARPRIDHISWGIAPWNTDDVPAALRQRGLASTVDTSDGAEIHVAQFKSYHTTTPNGYNLQISSSTHDTRLNLALAVNPRRPGVH